MSLPSTAPDAYGEYVLDWAVAVEEAGFDSVAVLGGTDHPGYDPVVTLSAVGAATRRVGLLGGFLVDPGYPIGLFARQISDLDDLVGQRLTLSIDIGTSVRDYFAITPSHAGQADVFEIPCTRSG